MTPETIKSRITELEVVQKQHADAAAGYQQQANFHAQQANFAAVGIQENQEWLKKMEPENPDASEGAPASPDLVPVEGGEGNENPVPTEV